MAGFTAGKLKVYALKFYWLEPGARMMLEIKYETISPGEMHMFLAKENKKFLSQKICRYVRRWEDKKLMVYKWTENHNQYLAQGTHWVSIEDIK